MGIRYYINISNGNKVSWDNKLNILLQGREAEIFWDRKDVFINLAHIMCSHYYLNLEVRESIDYHPRRIFEIERRSFNFYGGRGNLAYYLLKNQKLSVRNISVLASKYGTWILWYIKDFELLKKYLIEEWG